MYKLLFLVSFIAVVSTTFAGSPEQTFKLSGSLVNVKSDKIVLWFIDAENIGHSDTIALINGKFTFTGTVNRACQARLWTNLNNTNFDDYSVINFLLEMGDISISFDGSNPSEIQITGSPLQAEKHKWDAVKSGLLKEGESISFEINEILKLPESASRTHQIEQIGKRRKQNFEQIKSADVNYIKANPASLLSAALLAKHATQLPIDSVQLYYTNFTREVQQSRLAHDALKVIFTLTDDNEFRDSNIMLDSNLTKRFLALQTFYDLPLKDSAGKAVNLGELKGKLLVVSFWTSWCKPCIGEIPFINQLTQDYKTKNVEFVSISLDKSEKDWKKAMERNHNMGLQLGDTNSFYSLAAMFSKVLYVGRYLIIDQNGKIINYYAPHPSEPEMRTMIDSLLEES